MATIFERQDLSAAISVIACLGVTAACLDYRAVLNMFISQSKRTLDVMTFLFGTAFLISFAHVIACSRQGVEWLNMSTASIVLINSLGYLLVKFSRKLLIRVAELNNAGAKDKGSKAALLALGIAFTCLAVASAIVPADVYLDSLQVMRPSLTLRWVTVLSGWIIFFIIVFRCFVASGNNNLGELSTSTKRAAKARRDRMRAKTYPHPFPNGWYNIAVSEDVPIAAVKYIECLGKQLAVFRTESGKIAVMDAYCPHLGANLAVGGKVVGECIEW